ncbi:MAG: polysaccharide biosynthesis/export family protein [Micavibrio sp.]
MPVRIKTIFLSFLSMMLLTGVTGCTHSAPASKSVTEAAAYTLGMGDTVHITVFGHEDLSGDFTVEQDGAISFPLLRTVPAAGHTPAELQQMITAELSPAYVVDARVSVEIAAYRNIYILGEVQNPGMYEYIPHMTLLQAVAMAGGYSYRAQENRADITRHVKGAITTFTIDDKTMIKPGDTITVGRRWF